MTLTELLTAHPGVIVTLVYSGTHKLFSLTADRGSVEFATTWMLGDKIVLEEEVKRAMEAVKNENATNGR